MIAFSCAHCGMKLKVQDEFAGRQSKCPTCKQPLVVPSSSLTAPFVPPHDIDGAESSLTKAGVDGGVILDNNPAGRQAAVPGQKQRSVGEALARRQKSTQRYVIEGEIARGGMGAVLRAVDCDIRREVAVKYMLDDKDARKKARFIEEAQINGQLEHPNIVPVYDLGMDAQKRPFIMMKMVKGRSLKDVLNQLRDHPRQAEKEYTLGRLLNILVNACNALAFAHARGVVHRDLKPANIMLGDFGEVYVMDWGLAKVLNQPGATPRKAVPAPAVALPTPAASASGSGSHVVTSRVPEADLTQEGSVLGTPVYMPPEQATGNQNAIDQRSDVYSLGAILYEMLTLQPPVEKEGGYLAILMRVVQGEVVSPQQRNPQRTSAGLIPRELAAIAMKALARDQKNRYPTVDAFRQDIERFQEGRSVSAKEDTLREMVWKLVKRNKLVSALAVLLFVVLLWSSWSNFRARREAEQAQAEKNQHITDSLPSFVRAARLAASEKQYDDALKQLKLVLDHDPNHGQARLLRAQVLIVRQEFAEAKRELDYYLKLVPQDATAKQQVELCQKAKANDVGTLAAFAETLQRQDAELARQLMQTVAGTLEGRRRLLATYQAQLNAGWPGRQFGLLLSLDDNGNYFLNFRNSSVWDVVSDLTPLKGVPLNSLNLSDCGKILDLTPLKGMPLTWLDLGGCRQVRDLTPLKGMPLGSLNLHACSQVKDLTPLQGMNLGWLNLHDCAAGNLTPLQGMNLTEIIFTPRNITQGIDVLRQMKSLKTIGIVSFDPGAKWPAAEFWKRYDAGQFK